MFRVEGTENGERNGALPSPSQPQTDVQLQLGTLKSTRPLTGVPSSGSLDRRPGPHLPSAPWARLRRLSSQTWWLLAPGRRGQIKASDLRLKVPNPITRSTAASASLPAPPFGWGPRRQRLEPSYAPVARPGTALRFPQMEPVFPICESHVLLKQFPISPPILLVCVVNVLTESETGHYCQPGDGSRDYTNVSKCAMTNRGYFSAGRLCRPGRESKAASKRGTFKVFSQSLIGGSAPVGSDGEVAEAGGQRPPASGRPLSPRPAPGRGGQARLLRGLCGAAGPASALRHALCVAGPRPSSLRPVPTCAVG